MSQTAFQQIIAKLDKFYGRPQPLQITDPVEMILFENVDKILLFSQTRPILALESNGLRALVRLGFGEEMKNYAATYSRAQEAARNQLVEDCAWLIRAHLLLRRHGQELCKRTEPICNSCPLTEKCRYWKENSSRLLRDKISAKPPPKK